ncbi:hypothetical protein FA15DRAFT_357859 [Coprinopsis marcescibilis]|uniref:F-box domain-containing protein n=1 Tax=Coprinopsis marcescibilis TaxID=230819 RepID=A0A5C3KYG7_COPMA|nr:hypothetical protein FA15DRAFT_357859 [Coprinopsis marcescibilis]
MTVLIQISMSMMNTLPVEILEDILALVIPLRHLNPTSALLVCSTFNAVGRRLLYTHLRFYSAGQLKRFLLCYGSNGLDVAPCAKGETSPPGRTIPCPPRTIEFDLANDIATRLFYHMHALFLLYTQPSPASHLNWDALGGGLGVDGLRAVPTMRSPHSGVKDRLTLDALRLRFNSHTQDTDLEMISRALMLVNPFIFVWTGPDPLHHFSIAIVPPAVPYLFKALQGFSNLRELKLTHIAFVTRPNPIAFPAIPSLEKVYIGQATFVNPECISAAVLLSGTSPEFKLQEIRLVDAYKESIWGPRLRRSDLETAAVGLAQQSGTLQSSLANEIVSETSEFRLDTTAVQNLIHERVLCQAKSERIVGGDRVEFKANLI